MWLNSAVTKQDEVTLLGGDLNAAPYYGVADWQKGGEPTEDQMRSAMSYGVLHHYSGMSDLVVAGRPAGEETADVELGRSSPSSDSLPRYPFSSDRTNPLTLSQYGPDGSLARLDYIFGRGGGRIAVERSDMLFSENLPGLDYPLSDHFGFGVQLRIRPRVDLGQPSNSP